MKKIFALLLTLICVIGLVGCNQQEPEIIDIPDDISKVVVTFYSMGQTTEWELDETKVSVWKDWAENLTLKPLSEEKIEELQMTEGGESYHFEINNDEMSFTFKDNGNKDNRYIIFNGTYYRAVNATVPDVEPTE